MPIFCLSEKISFPPPRFAEPEGLLAVGGDLSERRLLLAYEMGIFPWFTDGETILWWSPDPRLLLYPENIHISSRLRRIIRQKNFKVTCDTAFEKVITACAYDRLKNFQETWIGDCMIEAYCRLFESGYAHSVEVWHEGELAGGLYGISLGSGFFGESMFTRISNGSKIALIYLSCFLLALSFDFIDCQVKTDHLKRMGAVEVSRSRFLKELRQAMGGRTLRGSWKTAFDTFMKG
ncbi:MAG: leucyl/phenylalanyl-tRNA--protein transferase [Desulfobacterales bacterium CG23_combo_of_CG06-09_8_20_14_all_51_8]|nr:MAG: leucyl/phenylalanyl-tRNA--protein transferase [Desulfobacterales bacterium CG23_combo_of_CG06-09_8_20_14_all_51_8]